MGAKVWLWSWCHGPELASVRAQSLQSCLTLATLWTVARQDPLSMGFSQQEHWSGLPCPPPGDLPNPGIEPTSFPSTTLTGGSFTTSATCEARPWAYLCPVSSARWKSQRPAITPSFGLESSNSAAWTHLDTKNCLLTRQPCVLADYLLLTYFAPMFSLNYTFSWPGPFTQRPQAADKFYTI